MPSGGLAMKLQRVPGRRQHYRTVNGEYQVQKVGGVWIVFTVNDDGIPFTRFEAFTLRRCKDYLEGRI